MRPRRATAASAIFFFRSCSSCGGIVARRARLPDASAGAGGLESNASVAVDGSVRPQGSAAASYPIGEVFALQVLDHHVEGAELFAVAKVEQRHAVRMTQRCDRLGFHPEPLADLLVRLERRVQNLDRDGSTNRELRRGVHRTHRPRAEERVEQVPTVDLCADDALPGLLIRVECHDNTVLSASNALLRLRTWTKSSDSADSNHSQRSCHGTPLLSSLSIVGG